MAGWMLATGVLIIDQWVLIFNHSWRGAVDWFHSSARNIDRPYAPCCGKSMPGCMKRIREREKNGWRDARRQKGFAQHPTVLNWTMKQLKGRMEKRGKNKQVKKVNIKEMQKDIYRTKSIKRKKIRCIKQRWHQIKGNGIIVKRKRGGKWKKQ